MNLLITDPFVPQSYYILHSLKHYCKRIIVARRKERLLPQVFSFTANSKYISKVYSVKYPLENWECAVFRWKNSESVENFIEDIISICKKEEVSLIYPTNDFTAYILSKNQSRFSNLDIKIPIQPIPLLQNIADKYKIIELAERENIPCPKTILVTDLSEFDRGISQLGFPSILKLRFGLGAWGIKFINGDNYKFVRKNLSEHISRHYVLQEFIPGKEMVYIRIYMNQRHRPVAESYVRNNRPELRIFQGRGISEETIETPEITESIKNFFRTLKYVGYGHVQLKKDADSGLLKLLELNFRISAGTWDEMSLGFNAPLVNYNLFYGADYGFNAHSKPVGIIFLYPVQDAIIFSKYLFYLLGKNIYKVISCLFNKKNPFDKLPPLQELVSDFKKRHILTKFSQREYDIFLTNLPKDPLVPLFYWLAFAFGIFFRKKYPHEF